MRAPAMTANEHPSPSAPCILVINDSPEILALLRDLLEEAGYRVQLDEFIGDVSEKMADIVAVQPDLLMLDLIIASEPLGWQVLQAVRREPSTAQLPVIVCTAAVRLVHELGEQLAALRARVILKPFDIDQLLAEVARALGLADDEPRHVPAG